jgi:hypothetical protein
MYQTPKNPPAGFGWIGWGISPNDEIYLIFPLTTKNLTKVLE